MQLAQKLAGYSLGEADMMRRAMGKKKREEMALHEEKFINGAVARQINQEKAAEIFKLMAQFADYGFNRSHSVAYAYLAYQTAYLKAHYPAYFYAAVLSNESNDTTKIYKYSSELRSTGLQFLPPDINESDADFTPLNNAVRFGLSAIKGLGASGIQTIIEARKGKKFTSLFDFTSRLDQGFLNRRGLESLISAGAFDTLMPEETNVFQWRASLFSDLDAALSHGQKSWQNKIRGQNDLFGASEASTDDTKVQFKNVPPWSSAELSKQEKAAVGFYLSNHPLDAYKQILTALKIVNVAEIEVIKPGDKIVLAGIVSGMQVRHSKKGNRFCIFRFEDQSVGVKCLAWAEAFAKNSQIIKDDELLIIEGKVESGEGQEITIILEDARKLADALPQKARLASITLPKKKLCESFLEELFTTLSRDKGNCEVSLKISMENKFELILQSQPLRIQGSSRLENELIEKGCQVNWVL
jgi:DNA polymerase-3 subunit alpha